MRGLRLLVVVCLASAPVEVRAQQGGGGSGADSTVPPLDVRVDSSRHELVLTAGPFHLPVEAPEAEQMAMQMNMTSMEGIVLQRFTWPMRGWVRGLRVALVGGQAHVLPQWLMHHLIMANFGRRQLPCPAAERRMAVSSGSAGG